MPKVCGHHEAHLDMEAQELGGMGCECGYSLDSLWRSAGSPAGRDPALWVHGFARKLLAGFCDYWAALDVVKGRVPDTSGAVWKATAEDVETLPERIQLGDFMAHDPVTRIYASFLDGNANGDDEERALAAGRSERAGV